jgi:hypothetical protein
LANRSSGQAILTIRKMAMKIMSFFEDHGDVEAELESIYKFRKEVQYVEREYLEREACKGASLQKKAGRS